MATKYPEYRSIILIFRYWMRRSTRLILGTCIFITLLVIGHVFWRPDSDQHPGVPVDLISRLRRVFSSGPESPKYLWSYIPGIDEAKVGKAEGDGWTWINSQRRPGYTRPSKGALSQQGAKSHLRTNLIEGKQYFTTFFSNGLNNQVMEVENTILLALRTGRIPILPPFMPETNHMTSSGTWLSVFEIFDVTEIIQKYNIPIVDMLELKVPHVKWATWLAAERHNAVIYDAEFPQLRPAPGRGEEEQPRSASQWLQKGDTIKAEQAKEDSLQCWSGSLPIGTETGGLYTHPVLPATIEWTPLPHSAYHRNHPNWGNLCVDGVAGAINAFSHAGDALHRDTLERLSKLGYPPSTMRPDDQIACMDHTFHTTVNPKTNEARWELRSGTGAWEAVGQYLKFQPGLLRMAQDLVRSLLDVQWNEPMPLYLAVHIRRSDLASSYRDITQRQWAHMAWKLLHELKQEKGLHVPYVLFTTDERNPVWLDELRKLGWVLVDHSKIKTGDRLNWWMPTILDSIILSSSQIFIGNPESTMSLLPYRRVLDWVGGIARLANPNDLHVPVDWEWKQDW